MGHETVACELSGDKNLRNCHHGDDFRRRAKQNFHQQELSYHWWYQHTVPTLEDLLRAMTRRSFYALLKVKFGIA